MRHSTSSHTNPPVAEARSIRRHRQGRSVWPLRSVGVMRSAAAALVLLAAVGCGTNPPVGPTPGESTVPTETAATPSAESALKINIVIDNLSVTPSGDKIAIDKDRSVVLVTRTDHDVTLRVQGAGIDQTVFVGRLSTISTTFVVQQAGTVAITSSDPAATIAELTVS